jgi:hypothetical protein
MTPAAPFPAGTQVRLSRPENPRHFRAGQAGVVRESGVHTDRQGAVRVWLWVDFKDCKHNGTLPFGSPAWGDEVEMLGEEPTR